MAKLYMRYFLTTSLFLLAMLYCLLNSIRKPLDACDYDNEKLIEAYYNLSNRPVINPVNKTYLITNSAICKNITPYLIVLVPSLPRDVHIRNSIRLTYGSMSSDKVPGRRNLRTKHLTRVIFLLGVLKREMGDEPSDNSIQEEDKMYHDIVQVDLEETYYNLAHKILHGLKWVDEFCSGVKYILKADSDVFVNIVNLLEQLDQYSFSPTGGVYGKVFNDEQHFVVIRSKNGGYSDKWAVSLDEYPLCVYPPYTQGTSYTLTGNLARKIVSTAQYLPYLHNEDVFITGIIAGQIHGAKFYNLVSNSNWGDDKPDPCSFAKQNRLSQTKMTPSLIYRTWSAINAYRVYCFRHKIKR